METFYFEKIKEIKANKEEIEKRLDIKIVVNGKKVTIEGDTFAEYEASIILEAMGFGFSASKALQLLEEEIVFRKIHMKDFTRRKDMSEVRGRVIGTHGKTKNTIEQVSGCDIVINDNEVGIIGSAESIELATTALKNLIKGSKQANVYRFLERTNKTKKIEDLGLKDKKNNN